MAVAALKKKAVTKAAEKKTAPRKKPAVLDPPPKRALDAFLGKAAPLWPRLMAAMKQNHSPFEEIWKPATKFEFDRVCVLQRKDRRLLYLVPKRGEVEAVICLGERAFDLAMASPSLSAGLKDIARQAPKYVEGHFIRFPLTAANIPEVVTMVELKLTPK